MGSLIVQTRERTANAVFSLFKLSGCSCHTIKMRLRKLKGVKEVTVDYVTNNVLVRFDPDRLTSNDIREFLRKLE
jgi:copper chaperone CopZ